MSGSYLVESKDRASAADEVDRRWEAESPFMLGAAHEFAAEAMEQSFAGEADQRESETAPAREHGETPAAAAQFSPFLLGESLAPEFPAPQAIGRIVPGEAGVRLEEDEFRVDRLPEKARLEFSKTDSAAWRQAMEEAIGAGISDPNDLADLIFFMQHRDRVAGGIGKPIDKADPDFFKLRAEWNLYRSIASRRLNPSAECPVFLPAQPSSDYEQYVAKATTGRITLLINGRTSGSNKTDAFDSMQQTVESLGSGDTVFLAAFQVNPTNLTGPASTGVNTWADLFVRKAREGVKIRIIMTDIPEHGPTDWKSDLSDLNAAIGRIPDAAARDNLKYIVSMHPAQLPFQIVTFRPLTVQVVAGGGLAHVATHHQKFMVVRKSGSTIAYCGGLDISPQRTPQGWPDNKLEPKNKLIWHDTHVKLEGLIARDLEREFVLRWNREKDKSTAAKLPDWKPFETLAQAPLGSSDREATRNTHKLQMLRTVSVGATTPDIRRDDVWQGYFRLIGCATQFLYMENQYFHEPAMADAIVKQAEAHPELIVIIVVAFDIDDPNNQLTEHGRAQQNEFFKRLFKIPKDRRRIYTMVRRLVHAKVIMADDRALSVGSTNANPRDFFMDTQLNVMLDDPQAVKDFRHQLWSHDLGVSKAEVAGWTVSDFIPQWDKVANENERLKTTPESTKGEDVIPFDPMTVKGKFSKIPDVMTEVDDRERGESESFAQAGSSESPDMPKPREDRPIGEDETPVVFEDDVPKTTPMSPFPARFADPLTATDNKKLSDAFRDAVTAVKASHPDLPDVAGLPIIIVPLFDDNTRPLVGFNYAKQHYAGSMLKIAAMFAAFQLRHAVNHLGATLDPTKVTDPAKFFAAVRKEFDSQILRASDLIKPATTAGNRAPQYDRIFTAAQDGAGNWIVSFRSDADPKLDFAGHLKKMIVDSHNPSAGVCIQALGFSWIDGLLQKVGLFDAAVKRGIWLAGDYLMTKAAIAAAHAAVDGDADGKEEFDLGISGWAEVRIPSENDGPSKQATTCIDAARLFVLLVDQKLVATTDPVDTANDEMLDLLHQAATGAGAASMVDRFPAAPAPFAVLQSKIGVGTLGRSGSCNRDAAGNTHGCVYSEMLIGTQAADPHRRFVAVWQNVKDAGNEGWKDITRIRELIQKTMDGL